jgi:hypothetical protein
VIVEPSTTRAACATPDQLTKLVELAFLRTWIRLNSTTEVNPCNPSPAQELDVSGNTSLGEILHSDILDLRESNPRPMMSQPQTAIAVASNASPLALHGRCILAVSIVISCRCLTPICNG